MNFFKIIVYPLSLLYGGVVYLRNKLYDKGLFRSVSFSIPVISIGNLTAGGSGKTPHTEYLANLLKKDRNVAILSRGYGRKTKGFKLVSLESSSLDVGDEPKQYKNKFPDLTVAVCEKRVIGIEKLTAKNSDIDTILLDDAFQHRSVKPALSILLVEYKNLYNQNHLLPSGTLREWSSGSERADIVIITKTPKIFVPMERRRAIETFKIFPHQQLFFSYIKYGHPKKVWNNVHSERSLLDYYEEDFHFIMVSGIADPAPFLDHVKERSRNVIPISFPDHHYFSEKDIRRIKDTFDSVNRRNKIILTTEKDAMRMKNTNCESLRNLPVFYLPIEVEFHNHDKLIFDEFIQKIN